MLQNNSHRVTNVLLTPLNDNSSLFSISDVVICPENRLTLKWLLHLESLSTENNVLDVFKTDLLFLSVFRIT